MTYQDDFTLPTEYLEQIGAQRYASAAGLAPGDPLTRTIFDQNAALTCAEGGRLEFGLGGPDRNEP